MSRTVPSKQDSMHITKRELGSRTVASHMLINLPKHIPLLKNESVRAALRKNNEK